MTPNWLDIIFTRLMLGNKATKTLSPAYHRMKAVVRKRTLAGPDGDHSRPTRQRLRQTYRLRDKQRITVAKQQAMRAKLQGGSARIRTVLDAELLMV